jgi:hypothetical protein
MRIESCRDLEPMGEREDRQQAGACPIEVGREAIWPRVRYLPGQQGPRYAVHGQPMLVEVEERRRRIDHYLLPGSAIARTGEAVRPGVQKRDPSGAALRRGGLEVVHTPQKLDTSVPQRRAEHPTTWQEDRLELAPDQSAGGWVVQEAAPFRGSVCRIARRTCRTRAAC